MSPRERFVSLLSMAGVQPEDRVLALIASNSSLAYRALLVATVEEACALYADATLVPRTETRAHVYQEKNIIIDGDMPVRGAQSAMFFYAFQDGVPRVLKVPRKPDAATREAMLYKHVGAKAAAEGVALVPVSYVELCGDHREETGAGRADVTLLRGGLLMPWYACTLAQLVPPARLAGEPRRVPPWPLIEAVLGTMKRALEFLHDAGWVHGDVKPSNVFMDADGGVHLGDYGSSICMAELWLRYGGGTPAYQCHDVNYAADPRRLDRVGLVLTVLELLCVLDKRSMTAAGWPLHAVRTAVDHVDNAGVQDQLVGLLRDLP